MRGKILNRSHRRIANLPTVNAFRLMSQPIIWSRKLPSYANLEWTTVVDCIVRNEHYYSNLSSLSRLYCSLLPFLIARQIRIALGWPYGSTLAKLAHYIGPFASFHPLSSTSCLICYFHRSTFDAQFFRVLPPPDYDYWLHFSGLYCASLVEKREVALQFYYLPI